MEGIILREENNVLSSVTDLSKGGLGTLTKDIRPLGERGMEESR